MAKIKSTIIRMSINDFCTDNDIQKKDLAISLGISKQQIGKCSFSDTPYYIDYNEGTRKVELVRAEKVMHSFNMKAKKVAE